MIPETLVIEEQRRRRERRWEPIPLHLPIPMPLHDDDRRPRQDTGDSGCVIIIDINDYSETRL